MVAESPGQQEVEEGTPLVGNTGVEFDRILREVGLQREKFFIVNAIACQPNAGRSEGEMRKAVNCCRPFFLAQLSGFKDDLHALAMGKWAAFQLTGKDKGVMLQRGFVRHEFRLPRAASDDDASE